MDNWKIESYVDLSKDSILTPGIAMLMFPGDGKGHTFRVHVAIDGKAADLSGATATGYFIRQDGTTVPVTGTVNGNVVSVTMVAECYAITGSATLTIRVIKGDIRFCVAQYALHINPSLDTSIVVPSGTPFHDVTTMLTYIDSLKALQTSLASYATDMNNLKTTVAGHTTSINNLNTVVNNIKSGTMANANLHLGLYIDGDGDICQVD